MIFYLGTHRPSWLNSAPFRLFVSHRILAPYRKLPRAVTPWALDSGGFTELSMFGEWRTTPHEYATAVRRYRDEVGLLEWAAPQDSMCEPWIIARTGLSVREHQAATVANFLELRALAPDLPFVPVLQGWQVGDYLRHVDDYAAAGVDLTAGTVGVGTVCRRQNTSEAALIFSQLAHRGLRLHGFGVKTSGLSVYADDLYSADSMAWSFRGRHVRPGCTPSHQSEANCYRFASAWREHVLAGASAPQQLTLDLSMTAGEVS